MDNIFFLSCFLPLVLIIYRMIPGIKSKNAVLLIYRPSWWQVMHVNCPIEEWSAVEQMTRQKLKPRKEVVRRVKIEG